MINRLCFQAAYYDAQIENYFNNRKWNTGQHTIVQDFHSHKEVLNMYVAASTKFNMSFMITTRKQPVQKYAIRSLLLPPPQKSIIPAVPNSVRPDKANTVTSNTQQVAEYKAGYDQSILFSGLTQLQKGNPVIDCRL